jgi:hypothetical protein
MALDAGGSYNGRRLTITKHSTVKHNDPNDCVDGFGSVSGC